MLRSKFLLIGLIAFATLLLSSTTSEKYPGNFYPVSDDLYRSEQPGFNEVETLENFGIKTFLNLRNRRTDKFKIKGSSIVEERVKMRASKISYNDMLKALKAYANAPKPVLVHCRRGSDRTGCFVACYNLLYRDYSKEQALKELLDEQYGYKKKLFPNIEEFIKNLDVDQLRSDLGLY